MKLRNLAILICGVALSGCHLDPAEPLSDEELYLRQFIKEYGLIDPDQNWNQARQCHVRVNTAGADEITVYVKILDDYYRVAYYANVEGAVDIPVDLPEDCTMVYVKVDGEVYTADIDSDGWGTVDATVAAPPRSRAAGDIDGGKDMAWLLVAEDLGSTDDYDFNDVIIRIEAVNTNVATLTLNDRWWQVIEDDDQHLTLEAPVRRAESRSKDYTRLKITSMCAGGILDSYLHFRVDASHDYILGPDNEWDLTSGTTDTGVHEWHEWFAEETPSTTPNHRNMLNTNARRVPTKTSVILVPAGFSMETYSQVLYADYDGVTDQYENDKYIYDAYRYSTWSYGAGVDYAIHGFYLTVGGPTPDECQRLLAAPRPGAAPQMFLIPDAGWGGYWHWPSERHPITDVYPRFAKWVHGTDADWYTDTPVSSAQLGETSQSDYYVR